MSGTPVVALEEHLALPTVFAAWARAGLDRTDPAVAAAVAGRTALTDVGAGRLEAMDEAGIDRQVLSLTTPGVQDLDPAEAVALQTATNDEIAALVRGTPARFEGFATLATPAPELAAAELRRAVVELGLAGAMVFPRTHGRPLDHPDLLPVFEAADALRAPLYLHPQTPPEAVRAEYYDGFDARLDDAFATHGVGWHLDAGVQLLRLMLAGVFDRFPDLRLVVGHWGESVLFFLERIDQLAAVAHLPRKPSEYVRDQVWVTPSGILSHRYLRWAVEIVGVDHLLFAADHPFVPLAPRAATRFLDEAPLPAVERSAVGSGNWNRLREQIRR